MDFNAVVEEKIRAAMEEGVFDDLPGKGEPLKNLWDNPHTPEAWRVAYRLLADNGYSLPWMDERKQIEEAVEEAQRALAGTYRETHRAGKQPDVWARAEWQRAANTFTETAAKLNKRIRDYNIQTPTLIFHRALVDAEKEIARVVGETQTAAMWDAAKK